MQVEQAIIKRDVGDMRDDFSVISKRLAEMPKDIPPKWLVAQVENNSQQIAELTALMRNFTNQGHAHQ